VAVEADAGAKAVGEVCVLGPKPPFSITAGRRVHGLRLLKRMRLPVD
jgi:hypothetical protein